MLNPSTTSGFRLPTEGRKNGAVARLGSGASRRAVRRSAARGGRRRGSSGVALVEFALIAPAALGLILGLLILGLVVLNQVELTNGVRDGARAAAVCGGAGFQDTTGSIKLPNGQACTQSNLNAYIQSRIQTIPGVTPTVQVYVNGAPQSLDKCQRGQVVSVTASYPQPLYAPLVGAWLGDPGDSGVRTINATAEATCEQ